MPTVNVPIKTALEGVKATTNQLTLIHVRLASVEMLVGGPYRNHAYGHTAVRVTFTDIDKVFDYGRYGRKWGLGDSEGEGILKIWSNFNAYIEDENSTGRVTTGFMYETTEDNARKVLDFFERKTFGKKPISEGRTMVKLRIEDYYALRPNCTTLSVDAIKTIFPVIDRDWTAFQKGRGLNIMEKAAVSARGWPKHLFMPADLQAMLESSSAKHSSKVIKYGNIR